MWDLYDKKGEENVWTPLPGISWLLWMAFCKINGVCWVGGGGVGDCSVAMVKQDADVVTGHPGKEAVIS